MNKIKIETLTSVHIGSGELLQYNNDFITDADHNIYVLDKNKMFNLIGEEHIDEWVVAIERGIDTKDFLQRYAPHSQPKDYAVRRIENFAGDIRENDSLKENIHDGRGLPYIPGSSIKGAIRTAIVSSLAPQIPGVENMIGPRASASNVEKYLFQANTDRANPQKDVLKYLRVGDAYFTVEGELATRLINLNITHKDDLIDKSKSQLVETIREEEKSCFTLGLDLPQYHLAKERNAEVGTLGNAYDSIEKIFVLINKHTQKLVNDEIDYWSNINKLGADDYVISMKEIADFIEKCVQGKECVLRIGHASGWRFTTGAWAEELENFRNEVVPAARPRNYNYEEYDFPKTRRIDFEGFVFGFVKLTIAE